MFEDSRPPRGLRRDRKRFGQGRRKKDGGRPDEEEGEMRDKEGEIAPPPQEQELTQKRQGARYVKRKDRVHHQ